jgi:hypothetical protein
VTDPFDLEVTAMLAERATVDPVTLARTRAFVAALPNRESRSARAFGPRRQWFGHLRVGLAIAAIVALVVGLAGFSALVRMRGEAAPSVVAKTPRPSPAYPQTAPVVLTGPGMMMFGWSPDGSHFAVGQSGEPYTIHLLDRTGREVGELDASQFGWLGPDRFVILRRGLPWNDGLSGDVYIGRLGSSELTKIAGDYMQIVSGPSGAMALDLDWPDPWLASYVVWSGNAFTQPRDGWAERWSRDGKALAVMHRVQSDPSAGWFEVVRPTGENVASVKDLGGWGNFRFSPNGASLAFTDTSYYTGVHVKVLDLRTGQSTTVPNETPNTNAYEWLDGETLLLPDGATRSTWSWSSITGMLTAFSPDALRGASGQGAVAMSGVDGSDAEKLTIRSVGANPKTLKVVDLGAPLAWDGLISESEWSPDGSSVVLLSGSVFFSSVDPVDVLLVSW